MTSERGTFSNEEMDSEIFREHVPLCKLLSKIPNRIHRGIMGFDLNLTCIAAHPKFLVLGVNAGLVYWYDRKLDLLTRLWCEDRVTPVSKVVLVESVEYLVAAGNQAGGLTVFQIPRPLERMEDSEIPSNLIDTVKQFQIPSQHFNQITALEWSRNGMRLFSGDSTGKVCMLDIDFLEQTFHPQYLCQETSSIVQLSYKRQKLIVSSLTRSTLLCVDLKENYPIGDKPRKIPGHFGGTFTSCEKGYIVRPKNTVYHVNVSHSKPAVKCTLLLDLLLKRPHADIPLLNPAIFQEDWTESQGDLNLIKHSSSLDVLVCYNMKTLHIINPNVPVIEASCSGLRGITDLALASSSGSDVEFEEIFVLEKDRNVIRISKAPDPYEDRADLQPLGLEQTESFGLETLSNSLAHLSESMVSKIASGDTLVNAITHFGGRFNPFNNEVLDDDYSGHDMILQSEEDLETIKTFQDISPSEYGKIVEKKGKPSKKSSGQDSKTLKREDIEAFDQDLESSENSFGKLELRKDEDIEESSGDSLQRKENELWKALKLDKIFKKSSRERDEQDSITTIESAKTENSLNYGPPSENSIALQPSSTSDSASLSSKTLLPVESNNLITTDDQIHEEAWEKVGQDWYSSFLPVNMSDFVTNFAHVYLVDDMFNVFIGKNDMRSLVWKKADYLAETLSVSPNGLMVWRLHQGNVYALKNFNNTESWFEVVNDVKKITLNDFSAFLVKENGDLAQMTDLSAARPFSDRISLVECEEADFVDIAVTNRLFVGVTRLGKVVGRSGIFQSNPQGNSWVQLVIPGNKFPVKADIFQQMVGTKLMFKVVIVTKEGEVLYKHGLLDDILFQQDDLNWYELSSPNRISLDSRILVKFSEHALYLGSPHMGTFFCTNSSFTGSSCEQIRFTPANLRIKGLSVQGLYKQNGLLWLSAYSLKPNCFDIYYSKLVDDKLIKISLPTSNFQMKCLADAPESLWVLSNQGHIYIRTGVSPDTPEGNLWSQLDVTQLGKVTLSHIALGSDCVWALDESGKAWMRLGSLNKMEAAGTPVWFPVEGSEGATDPRLAKVFASSSLHMVWAVDVQHNIFVRTGIFPDFRLGLDWVPVEGLEGQVTLLALSEDAVWALTFEGKVFKRCGISNVNFIGDFWKPIPTCGLVLTQISTSVCGKLFGVSKCGRIVEILSEKISVSHPKLKKMDPRRVPEILDENIDGGWAVVT